MHIYILYVYEWERQCRTLDMKHIILNFKAQCFLPKFHTHRNSITHSITAHSIVWWFDDFLNNMLIIVEKKYCVIIDLRNVNLCCRAVRLLCCMLYYVLWSSYLSICFVNTVHHSIIHHIPSKYSIKPPKMVLLNFYLNFSVCVHHTPPIHIHNTYHRDWRH